MLRSLVLEDFITLANAACDTAALFACLNHMDGAGRASSRPASCRSFREGNRLSSSWRARLQEQLAAHQHVPATLHLDPADVRRRAEDLDLCLTRTAHPMALFSAKARALDEPVVP